MSSDSSSSDSEISGDEELDQNVFKAFQAVKLKLNAAGVKRNENTKKVTCDKKPQEKTDSSTRHQLIYQTFRNLDNNKNNAKISSVQGEETVSSTETDNCFSSFYIDKSTSLNTTSTKDINSDDVVAYDLTNISESGVQVDDDIVSYDLTNIQTDDHEADIETKNFTVSNDEDSDKESVTEEKDNEVQKRLKKERKKQKRKEKGLLSSHLEADVSMKDVYINVDPLRKSKSHKTTSKDKQKHPEPEIMKKSVITEDFERQDSIQTTHVSIRQQKKQRKLEREKTKGGKWYNLPATELTDERKYDLTVLQMRKALDPKRFYKANDLKAAPKYFQFGQVVEDATDFYSSRIPKKQRKSTVVEELLADAEFRKFNKRKYEEVQDAKRHGKGPYKHMKRLKKRKR